MTLRLNLGQYLKEHGITAYRLVREMEGKVASNTIYGMARKPAQRIDLNTVGEVLKALGRLTGGEVELSDVIEKREEPKPDVSTLGQNEDFPLYDPEKRKTFRYSGHRAALAPGPSAEALLAELRGHE